MLRRLTMKAEQNAHVEMCLQPSLTRANNPDHSTYVAPPAYCYSHTYFL